MLQIAAVYGVDQVVTNLKNWADESRQAVEATCRGDVAPMIENYMKTNAPWRDQTGNARRGLVCETKYDRGDISLLLKHSVHYGVYLELAKSGMYAIISPTLSQFAPTFATIVASGIGWSAR